MSAPTSTYNDNHECCESCVCNTFTDEDYAEESFYSANRPTGAPSLMDITRMVWGDDLDTILQEDDEPTAPPLSTADEDEDPQ